MWDNFTGAICFLFVDFVSEFLWASFFLRKIAICFLSQIRITIEHTTENKNKTKQNVVFTKDMKCVGLARIGHDSQIIKYGTLSELMAYDFGEPLHSFVIPGTTHFLESDVLKMYEISQNNENTKNKE